MDIPSLVRVAICALLLVVTTACAPNQPAPLPPVVTREVPAVVPLPAVLEAPQQWSGRPITLIAPLQPGGEARILGGLAGAEDMSKVGIWLAQPLPEDVRRDLQAGDKLLKLEGTLSPPGAYGAQQRFPYQFTAEQVATLVPERTTIANLALNPAALDKIALRISGTLLLRPDAALLVDEVSAGGVPSAGARQLKVRRMAINPSLIEAFNSAGDVRWGAVEIVGWWQNRALTPLLIAERGSTAVTSEPDGARATVEP